MTGRTPPGYSDIQAVRSLGSDDPGWMPFLRKVLALPEWMVPAAQEAVRQGRWAQQPNPIGFIKTATYRIANRMGLTSENYKGPPDRSRRCKCGAMFAREAVKVGHSCWAGEIDSFHLVLPDLSESKDRVGKRYDATDFMDYIEGDYGCRSSDDQEDDFYIRDSKGRLYTGSRFLNRVHRDFIKLLPDSLETPSSVSVDSRPIPRNDVPIPDREYGHPITLNDDPGHAVIDWLKVAEKAGLGQAEGEVLELRYGWGLSRDRVLECAQTSSQKKKRQAAWRAIDRHSEEIRKLLSTGSPEDEEWRRRQAAKPNPPRQIAPPVRKTQLPMPDRPNRDAEVLEDLNRRFGADSKLWGQHLKKQRTPFH